MHRPRRRAGDHRSTRMARPAPCHRSIRSVSTPAASTTVTSGSSRRRQHRATSSRPHRRHATHCQSRSQASLFRSLKNQRTQPQKSQRRKGNTKNSTRVSSSRPFAPLRLCGCAFTPSCLKVAKKRKEPNLESPISSSRPLRLCGYAFPLGLKVAKKRKEPNLSLQSSPRPRRLCVFAATAHPLGLKVAKRKEPNLRISNLFFAPLRAFATLWLCFFDLHSQEMRRGTRCTDRSCESPARIARSTR